MKEMCYCGRPLHYLDRDIEKIMSEMVSNLGEFMDVRFKGKVYLVPRHYVALHGIKGENVEALGFKEKSG